MFVTQKGFLEKNDSPRDFLVAPIRPRRNSFSLGPSYISGPFKTVGVKDPKSFLGESKTFWKKFLRHTKLWGCTTPDQSVTLKIPLVKGGKFPPKSALLKKKEPPVLYPTQKFSAQENLPRGKKVYPQTFPW